MRKEIRQLLVDQVITAGGRVYEPSAAGPDLVKPFLVLREGVQNPGEDYAAYTTAYEVWPYVEHTTFQKVDSLAKEVIEALDKKRFNVAGVPHYIEYTGTLSDDIVDEEWKALTRGLRFRVFSLAWLVHVPVNPDPVEAIKAWTISRFINLQTDPSLWDPQDTTPALYWRQAAIQNTESVNWGAWITARVHGHIIAPGMPTRKEWTEKVVRQIALDRRTKMSDGSRIAFLNVLADSGYDPFQQGQVQLDVRYGVLKETAQYPSLTSIGTGTIYGGVELGQQK